MTLSFSVLLSKSIWGSDYILSLIMSVEVLELELHLWQHSHTNPLVPLEIQSNNTSLHDPSSFVEQQSQTDHSSNRWYLRRINAKTESHHGDVPWEHSLETSSTIQATDSCTVLALSSSWSSFKVQVEKRFLETQMAGQQDNMKAALLSTSVAERILLGSMLFIDKPGRVLSGKAKPLPALYTFAFVIVILRVSL